MVNIVYIPRESDSVSLVFIVKIAWGKKEAVVKNAAQKPIISVMLIVNSKDSERRIRGNSLTI